jgi:calcineurin-like phosphoesterase family protein
VHLTGNSHGNLVDIGGKIVDVGVDVWNYAPVSLDQIKEYMDKREIVTCDHHAPEEEEE